ncbi:helicase [Candidatus Parcubacteria bacterium]|nr:MAG: helicase [Candidatus Parcubacteria bacterium]
MASFLIGSMVHLVANPERKGVVLSVTQGQGETRYQVFLDGKPQMFYESQLVAEPTIEAKPQFSPLEDFHLFLTALQIRHPSCSTLYSLNAARIDFIPYQFRPALKFIRSDRPRMLIADGVGVGKTIEAGLILRELQARSNIQSVLVICPRPLVTEKKWEIEMRRFDERFIPLDGPLLRRCINETDLEGRWPIQYQKAILPYSLLTEELLYGQSGSRNRRSRKGLLDLDPPPRFALVIVDEAHHIRNPKTYSHQAVSFFCEHAEAAIFLTATPIQLGSQDLYTLLHVLRPDLVIDWESYRYMAEPNPYINEAVSHVRAGGSTWNREADAALQNAAETAWGRSVLCRNPEFKRVRHKLQSGAISNEERIRLIRQIEDLHTFSGIINRTRRRDIGHFTTRKPETISVPFTDAQQDLHDRLIAAQARILEALHGEHNVKFMMTTLRRQAASCLFGLAPMVEDILTRRIDNLEWLAASDSELRPDDQALDALRREIDEVIQAARNLPEDDPKLKALKRIIADKHRLPNNKLMIFSTFRHTLTYLSEHLQADGYRVGLIHGGTPDEERAIIRDRFEAPRDDPEALDILLFSEVGCEGLDYQFCDCIVNYDIPWNPMRIEQRIGRIDRQGQRSESIAIYNFITPGTVDAEIYERCLMRIGIFNESLGESEEILGEIHQQIRDIAENLSLSPEERRQKLRELADNEIRRIEEQRRLEESEAEFFGIKLPKELASAEVQNASSAWLAPDAIQRLVRRYLEVSCGEGREYILGEKPLKTLRLSLEARKRLLEHFEKLPRQDSPMFRDWERWLKGSEPHLPITFDSETASRHKDAAFIMPLHPLARQAAYFFEISEPIITALQVTSRELPPGRYQFAVYAWEYHGLRNDLETRIVCQNKTIMEALPALIEEATPLDLDPSEIPDQSVFDSLDSVHYHMWVEARNAHKQHSENMANVRRESLTRSHNARIRWLEEQLEKAGNEKIRRMRRSQIDSAEADYGRRMEYLVDAGKKADIVARPIAFGVLQVLGEG